MKQDLNVFYQVCVFRTDRKTKIAALVSDWLRFCRQLFSETAEWNTTKLDKRQDLNFLSLVCVRADRGNQNDRPLIGLNIFDFFSNTSTAEWNTAKLDRKKNLNILFQFAFFWSIGKPRWPPWPLIGCDIFDYFSEATEWNSMKFYRKQDRNCVFRAKRKTKMAALASDWVRHFWLLLWNRWMEFQRNLRGGKYPFSTSSATFVFLFSGRS